MYNSFQHGIITYIRIILSTHGTRHSQYAWYASFSVRMVRVILSTHGTRHSQYAWYASFSGRMVRIILSTHGTHHSQYAWYASFSVRMVRIILEYIIIVCVYYSYIGPPNIPYVNVSEYSEIHLIRISNNKHIIWFV